MEVALVNSFHDIEPEHLYDRGFKLLGVDIENVITDYRSSEVFPGVAEKFEELETSVKGLKTVLITNSTDIHIINEVLDQIGDHFIYSPIGGYNKKPSSDMFRAAICSEAVYPNQAALVDDQFKSYFGAKNAGYRSFFWTLPDGENSHPAVKAFRPVETSLIRPYYYLKNIANRRSDSILS